ncbi:MAG: mycothiol transferase [Acidimicrobiales bacterium]
MDTSEILIDLFGRVAEHVGNAVEGLDAEQLATPPVPGSNPIGWLIWHLTRVEDAHVAELLEDDQIWTTGDYARRVGVEPDPHNSGYGHTPEQVASIRPEGPEVLLEYYGAVAARTKKYLEGVTAADLDRIVDERWDPPVTLGVRLVSIADDELQHGGQANYARGILLGG